MVAALDLEDPSLIGDKRDGLLFTPQDLGLSGLEGRDLDDMLVALEGVYLQDYPVSPVYNEKAGVEDVSLDLLHRPPIPVHRWGFTWLGFRSEERRVGK